MGARAKILVLLQEHMRSKKMKIMKEISNDGDGNDHHDNSDAECRPAFDTIIREMLLEKNKYVKSVSGREMICVVTF